MTVATTLRADPIRQAALAGGAFIVAGLIAIARRRPAGGRAGLTTRAVKG